MKPLFLYTLMITLGVSSGLSGIHFLEILGSTLSDIFIRIFKCISMPIIALSIIVTLSNVNINDKSMTSVWRKTLSYTLITTIIAASISCLLYFIIQPANLTASIQQPPLSVVENTSYLQHLSSIVPTNFFAPFIEQQVIAVLLIGLTIGTAIRYIPEKNVRLNTANFFKGIHGIFFVITKWLIIILPIGLFGFVTTMVVQLRDGMAIKGIVWYLLIIIGSNVIQGFIVLPAWLYFNGMKPFKMMIGMMPALSTAFFSKSSAGTLPITIETAEKKLNIHPSISRFVLPLCTTINMNGCAAFIFTTVIFMLQNHGVDITLFTMISWIVIATIAAVGNAGVPMGCFFLSASLLTSMDIPIVLLGIILPFYAIIDMVETSLNVWSDSCITAVVNKEYLIKKTA